MMRRMSDPTEPNDGAGHAVSTNFGEATGPVHVRDRDQFPDFGRDSRRE